MSNPKHFLLKQKYLCFWAREVGICAELDELEDGASVILGLSQSLIFGTCIGTAREGGMFLKFGIFAVLVAKTIAR